MVVLDELPEAREVTAVVEARSLISRQEHPSPQRPGHQLLDRGKTPPKEGRIAACQFVGQAFWSLDCSNWEKGDIDVISAESAA